ncbi:MAG: hypothetical protein ACOH2D_16235 [Gelidibacter sp.]
MAQISKIKYSQLSNYFGRIDAEFYKPISLYADQIIKKNKHKVLGHIVADGYRVVYENTKILRDDKIDIRNDARFLQATNISIDGLWIETNDIGFVKEQDWNRYPKGRIEIGEILIEVKGAAEKVTIVQDYMPERTLVTGTLFKLTLKPNTISSEYLFAFFSSKYGKILRDRTKVNTLIAYVSKPELYRIPIPILDDILHNEITELVKQSFVNQHKSQSLYQQATTLLEKELGLDNSDLDDSPNKYNSSFNDVILGKRLDPEFYNPRAKTIVQRIKNLEHTTIAQNFYIKNGFPWNSKKFIEDNSGEPVIRIRNVKPTYIDKQNLTSITKDYANTINFPKAKAGDVVIGMDGLKYFYGSILEEDCMVNQRVCHIERKNPDSISSEYTTFIINSAIGQAQLLRDMTIATTVGHITNLNVAKLVIPIVSKNFHDKITDLVRKSINADKKSKLLLKEAIQRVEELIESAAENN